MIKSFKHKGLQKFYETGSTQGVQAAHADKLRMQLAALYTACIVEDLDIPATDFINSKEIAKGFGPLL